MEDKDLIKKLKNAELPKIELQSHKRRLRAALLGSNYFQKPNFLEVFEKSFVFSLPVLFLLLILGVTVIQPKLTEIQAFKLAKSDPQIKKLMEEKDMFLKEARMNDGRAYILLNPPEAEPIKEEILTIEVSKTKKEEAEDIEGAIVEINLSQKKVEKIEPIKGEDILPLAKEEEEEVKEIVEAEETIKKIIPQGAKFEKITSFIPQKLQLIKKDNKVEAVPHPQAEKRAQVHYTLNGEKWTVQVNLATKKIEKVQYSPDNQ